METSAEPVRPGSVLGDTRHPFLVRNRMRRVVQVSSITGMQAPSLRARLMNHASPSGRSNSTSHPSSVSRGRNLRRCWHSGTGTRGDPVSNHGTRADSLVAGAASKTTELAQTHQCLTWRPTAWWPRLLYFQAQPLG